MRVEIKSRTIPYQFTLPNGHVLFKIEEATLAHETFTGGMTSEITRVNFERGDGVGVLLYAQDTDEVVLIEQFRHRPAHAVTNGIRRAFRHRLHLLVRPKSYKSSFDTSAHKLASHIYGRDRCTDSAVRRFRGLELGL
jgi:hypothetical protein